MRAMAGKEQQRTKEGIIHVVGKTGRRRTCTIPKAVTIAVPIIPMVFVVALGAVAATAQTLA